MAGTRVGSAEVTARGLTGDRSWAVVDPDGKPVPNRVQPGKRPLSSMAPVIVLHGGRPVLVLGGTGGSSAEISGNGKLAGVTIGPGWRKAIVERVGGALHRCPV